ncbi:hypothetical protein MTR67_038786 [Solanum verrucosum]|uniref:MADS-box domain-containing protein n=1 Tax=Solanum verrucosum TaxID=315347 RepID=A0AAF0UH41_SOLVR|nr:hypothetical protein MTR67_038786 [Solanum verrucosum]
MDRKIEIKKTEDTNKCKAAFPKRCNSLLRKAEEIAICCDVDVLFVAFSPSNRVNKFCSQKRYCSYSTNKTYCYVMLIINL